MSHARVRVSLPAFWIQRAEGFHLTTCLAQYSHSHLCLAPRLQPSTEVEEEWSPEAWSGGPSGHCHQPIHSTSISPKVQRAQVLLLFEKFEQLVNGVERAVNQREEYLISNIA